MPGKKRRFLKRLDFVLFFTVIMLCLYGILVISSATKSDSLELSSLSFIKTQAASTILGIIIIAIIMNINYEIFGKLYIPIYVVCNLMLLSVFLFGTGSDEWGARSWIRIGTIGFQPAEVAKVGIILSVAKLIEKNQSKINELFTLIKILVFAFVPIAFILKEPDFGTSMVYVFFVGVMIFTAGLDVKYILYAALSGILSAPLVWLSLGNYQRERVLNFLDPSRDVMGSSYQAIQSKIAVGSGKIFGMGLYKGTQTQFGFLPEKQTDFIFSVVGEELGLIGGLILISLYFIMLYRLINIARQSRDMYGTLVVIGITSMMFIHIFQNIAMTMGVMPITGIPLPFMSYGGTFQLTNMIAIGIALNISVKRDRLSF